MKTAISVPDDTFERVARRAGELGMSRSEFFSRAAQEYLDRLDTGLTTRRIDDALAALDEPDDSAVDAVDAAHRLLADVSDRW